MADSDNDSGGQNVGNAQGELSLREQDRFLPIANVSRIMKKALPANAKISKDAKETVQECVSEFISFITGEASDKCQREKRKTINGDDLLWAMTTLGFEEYVEPLKVYLQRFREMEGEKTVAARDKEGSGVNSGYDYGAANAMGIMMHHQGHVYGSHVMGNKGGPSYPAAGSNNAEAHDAHAPSPHEPHAHSPSPHHSPAHAPSPHKTHAHSPSPHHSSAHAPSPKTHAYSPSPHHSQAHAPAPKTHAHSPSPHHSSAHAPAPKPHAHAPSPHHSQAHAPAPTPDQDGSAALKYGAPIVFSGFAILFTLAF